MPRKLTSILAVILAVPLAYAGCQKTPTRPTGGIETSPDPLTNLSVVQQNQKTLAMVARDRLFQSLLGELTKSLADNGPATSISVCKTRVPDIAAVVEQETGVRIGRTSVKLRNANNRPPEWAAKFVADKTETEVEVALPENGLGVLLPIRLKATCLLCHGAVEQLMPDVKEAIASHYPDDQATGFAEGDLRGYFWVEVPTPHD